MSDTIRETLQAIIDAYPNADMSHKDYRVFAANAAAAALQENKAASTPHVFKSCYSKPDDREEHFEIQKQITGFLSKTSIEDLLTIRDKLVFAHGGMVI